MGLTLTVEEAKSRTAYDLIQEATQTQQPLIVMLEGGAAITIQQYQPAAEATAKVPKLEPLPQFAVGIADGWVNAVYAEK